MGCLKGYVDQSFPRDESLRVSSGVAVLVRNVRVCSEFRRPSRRAPGRRYGGEYAGGFFDGG
jgi:hypothetical protein